MATIRGAVECLTCSQVHTVRIGLGQEATQQHTFACRGCNEDVTAHLDVSYKPLGAAIRAGANAKVVAEVGGSPIVNLDANFLIPDSDQGRDFVMPRVTQMFNMFKIAEAAGRVAAPRALTPEQKVSRPYRQPDYAEEWQPLKKAWSLARSGKDKLSKRALKSGSAQYYSSEPLKDLHDWMWRFALFVSGPLYEKTFVTAQASVRTITDQKRMADFQNRHDTELSAQLGTLAFDAFKEFFAGFPEFGQVFFFVRNGISIPKGLAVSSMDFEKVKMTYGNLYETWAA